MSQMMNRATTGFQEMLQEKARWIAHKVWDFNIPSKLDEVNKMIASAKRLGVTQSDGIPKPVCEALVPIIADLRNLGMEDDIKALLAAVLLKSGVKEELLTFDHELLKGNFEIPASIVKAYEPFVPAPTA